MGSDDDSDKENDSHRHNKASHDVSNSSKRDERKRETSSDRKPPKKKQRFNAVEVEDDQKWNLNKDDAKYVHKRHTEFLTNAVVKEKIMDKLPVPDNVIKPLKLDDIWEAKLEKKNSYLLTQDADLVKHQEKVRDIDGPLLHLWKQADDAVDGKRSLKPKEVRSLVEKTISLVGRVYSGITHQRRSKVLNQFTKDKRKVAKVLKDYQSDLQSSKKWLFGSKVNKRFKKKAKARKNIKDFDNLFSDSNKDNFQRNRSSGRNRQRSPFQGGSATTGRSGGAGGAGARHQQTQRPRNSGKSSKKTSKNKHITITSSIRSKSTNTKREATGGKSSHKKSVSRETTTGPSGRPTKVLPSKLGKDHKRSEHTKYCPRTGIRIPSKALAKERTATNKYVKTRKITNGSRNKIHAKKGSNHSGQPSERTIRKLGISEREKRWRSKTHHKSKKSKQDHSIHPFQNGIDVPLERSARSKRLHGESRSKRCVFLGASPQKHEKVHAIQMGGDPVRVHLPLLRPRTGTKSIHQTHESPNYIPSQTKYSSDNLLRRYTHSREDNRRSDRKSTHSRISSSELGFRNKSKEVGRRPDNGNRIPRFSDKFKNHDDCSPREKSEKYPKSVQKSDKKAKNYPKEFVKTDREIDFNITGNSTSPNKIQKPPTMPNQSNKTKTEHGSHDPAGEIGKGGTKMVDAKYETTEWQTHKNRTSRPDNISGCCLNRGLGCSLRKISDRGALDGKGKGSSHKHIRNGGGLFGDTFIHQNKVKHTHTFEVRQHHNTSLSSQNGGDQEYETNRNGNRHLELHVVAPNLPDGGTYPREDERAGRLGIEEPERFLRVETEPKSFHTTMPTLGDTIHRSVCLQDLAPTRDLLCLETGPLQQGNRCDATKLEKHIRICFPPFQYDRKGIKKNDKPKIPVDFGNTSMAVAKLVPPTITDIHRSPSSSPTKNTTLDISSGSSTSPNHVQQLETGSMEVVRRPDSPNYLSTTAASLMVESRRQGTRAGYASAWTLWESWCLEREIDPTGCSLNYILSFLADLYQRGMAYNTIGKYRSTISAFHAGFNGISVGNTLEVKRLMKGVANQRPPKPKYTVVWDVEDVLRVLKALFPHEGLTDKLLTEKTAMLLSLIAIPRGCELTYLKLELMGIGSNIIKFSFDRQLKTTKPGTRPEDLEIHKFEENPRICPMGSIQSYLERTKTWRKNPKLGELFISHVKPHEPVHKSTIARWIKNVMEMAEINTNSYCAHSARSAASSKAKKQGLSVDDILKRGNWSRESTWQKFYHKPSQNSAKKFQNSILS